MHVMTKKEMLLQNQIQIQKRTIHYPLGGVVSSHNYDTYVGGRTIYPDLEKQCKGRPTPENIISTVWALHGITLHP